MNKPPTLKTPEDIAALSDSDTYQALDKTRRDQLVTQITSAQGELQETLPVLLSHSGSALESAFIRDLLAPPGAVVPVVEPEPETATAQKEPEASALPLDEPAKPQTPEVTQ